MHPRHERLPGPVRFAALCGLVAAAAVPLAAEDWPQWRGPERDGVWREDGLVERFANDTLEARWRAPIGSGYSGPTVADGRVFLTDQVRENVERVLCFDAATGEPLWQHEYDAVYTIGYRAGPRASVTVQDGHAFAVGARKSNGDFTEDFHRFSDGHGARTIQPVFQ